MDEPLPPPGHLPVLRKEVVETLSPSGRRVVMDCTCGLGGHAQALLDAADERTHLIAVDLDESNLRRAKDRLAKYAPRVRFFQANFADAKDVLAEVGVQRVDAVLADLGVASSQLDDARRGLSFSADGPLDMRLDQNQQITAAILVNSLGERPLADLIFKFGEERYSRRIARAIVLARKDHTISGTKELAEIVARAQPSVARQSRRGVHPATRTFQALRIAVNRELESLDRLLAMLPDILNVGGRAAIISFHSLEDRRVKQAFAQWASSGKARLLTKKPVEAGRQEAESNPRSRSAKLRGVEKVQD
jgi:16S rRNA (cytosine1402-N4)-methyltransferase